MSKRKNHLGNVYGKLTVIKDEGNNAKGNSRWRCLCECGNETVVNGFDLGKGSKSCGCMFRTPVKHGMSNTPIYRVWATMHSRCYNPNFEKYKSYGARGIKVCERWHSFEHFYTDMGDRPSPHHSIERSDVNGNYCPDNCVWATLQVQANNRRNNVMITLEGDTMTIADACRKYNKNRNTIGMRLFRGWSIEKAFDLE